MKGNILDKDDLPVTGANILEKGTTNDIISDVDDNFTITVSDPKAVLFIRYTGHKDVEKVVSPTMKIVIEEDSKMLEDIVVIDYGSVRKSGATGSVTAIKPDGFNKGLRTTIQDALVGKVPGINVISSSDTPGASAATRIRNGASLSAFSDPLIVVDGVPMGSPTIEGGGNIIGGINPNGIETFTVLKSVSVTVTCGFRASNDVIVIVTERGSDSSLCFNYSTNLSVGIITKKLDVLSADEFREFIPTVSGVPSFVTLGTASTDWQDEICRTAFGQEHNFFASGKVEENIPYRLSVGYNNQSGVVKANDYERFIFGGNISPKFFDNHLIIDLNVEVSYEGNQKVDESVVNNTLRYDPTHSVITRNAMGVDEPELGYFIWVGGNSSTVIQIDNPVIQLELQDLRNKVTRFTDNAAINYRVYRLEDLQLSANSGYDVLRSRYTKNVPDMASMMYISNMKDGVGLIYDSKQNKRNYLLDLYANYPRVLNEKHDLSAMAGYGWQRFRKKFDATTLSPEGKELFSSSYYESEYCLFSLYGRLNYSYDNRCMITVTLRSDTSSRSVKNNRRGLFPSAALGWEISQEAFLHDSEVSSDLELRLSYGQIGRQDVLNDYPYMTTFTMSYSESCYQFGDRRYYTYRPNGYDSDIKWETTETYSIGLDYGLLNNRIYGSVDYYQHHTKDLLSTINVISGTNYSSVITTNTDEMDNKGVKFAANAVLIHTKNWKWTVDLNHTWNDSETTKLSVIDLDANFVQTGAISGTSKTVQVFMVDQRPHTFYLAKQIYDDNGKPIEEQYVQLGGSISATETKYATNRDALPTSYLGFDTQLTYKSWDFTTNGHGTFGNHVCSYVAANQCVQPVHNNQGDFPNILRRIKDSGFQNQQLYSDYFLEKGNPFRIDNISLGYTSQKLWNGSSFLRLILGIQNVVAFTSYSGIDPGTHNGIDREVHPRPCALSLSTNLNF